MADTYYADNYKELTGYDPGSEPAGSADSQSKSTPKSKG